MYTTDDRIPSFPHPHHCPLHHQDLEVAVNISLNIQNYRIRKHCFQKSLGWLKGKIMNKYYEMGHATLRINSCRRHYILITEEISDF